MMPSQVYFLNRLSRFSHCSKMAICRSESTQSAAGLSPQKKISYTSIKMEQARRDRLNSATNAMKVYMRSLQENADEEEINRIEFEKGKRHLANIMGFDPDEMTQQHINSCISYLFPSGLHDPKARPRMKFEDNLFPVRVIDIDASGWPNHALFYTLQPKFYSLLSDVNRRTLNLIRKHDQLQLALQRGKISPEEASQGGPLTQGNYSFIERTKLSARNGGEPISNIQFKNFVQSLQYMASLPNASLEARFLSGFRIPHSTDQKQGNQVRLFRTNKMPPKLIPDVTIDKETGRRQACGLSSVKATRASALVQENGTGILTVDGHHYDVFRDMQAREILLSPMIVTGLLGKVDVHAKILKGPGGKSVTPRAVRHATALALAALFPELAERMRLAGLLNPDLRMREREKINQPGARAKWIWKKR